MTSIPESLPAELRLGYCPGVGAGGLPCFVRDHCMHFTHPSIAARTIDPPFRWWLSDHTKWTMECPEYVVDVIAVKQFPYDHRLDDDVGAQHGG